ncbi:MAG: hypothetical protein ACLFTZ_02725, partial [Acholeplasmataceae bacterium]
MTKKSMKKPQNRNFWQWIHRNRILILIVTFLVIVPLTLVIVAYVGAYVGSQKFYFAEEMTEDVERVRDFDSPDSISAFDLSLEWTRLAHPDENEEGELEGGYYQFSLGYDADDNYDVQSVQVTPLLQTDWARMRSLGSKETLREGADNPIRIPFDYELPTRPLWFVNVTEPTLYLRVEYTILS